MYLRSAYIRTNNKPHTHTTHSLSLALQPNPSSPNRIESTPTTTEDAMDSDEDELQAQMGEFAIPSGERGLRACMVCTLIQTYNEFYDRGTSLKRERDEEKKKSSAGVRENERETRT